MRQNDKRIAHLPDIKYYLGLGRLLGSLYDDLRKPSEIAEVTHTESAIPKTEIAYIIGIGTSGNSKGLIAGKTISPKSRRIHPKNLEIYLLKDVVDYRQIKDLRE